jgi:hypothetical protein
MAQLRGAEANVGWARRDRISEHWIAGAKRRPSKIGVPHCQPAERQVGVLPINRPARPCPRPVRSSRARRDQTSACPVRRRRNCAPFVIAARQAARSITRGGPERGRPAETRDAPRLSAALSGGTGLATSWHWRQCQLCTAEPTTRRPLRGTPFQVRQSPGRLANEPSTEVGRETDVPDPGCNDQ